MGLLSNPWAITLVGGIIFLILAIITNQYFPNLFAPTKEISVVQTAMQKFDSEQATNLLKNLQQSRKKYYINLWQKKGYRSLEISYNLRGNYEAPRTYCSNAKDLAKCGWECVSYALCIKTEKNLEKPYTLAISLNEYPPSFPEDGISGPLEIKNIRGMQGIGEFDIYIKNLRELYNITQMNQSGKVFFTTKNYNKIRFASGNFKKQKLKYIQADIAIVKGDDINTVTEFLGVQKLPSQNEDLTTNYAFNPATKGFVKYYKEYSSADNPRDANPKDNY